MEDLTDKMAILTGLYKGQTLYKTADNLHTLTYEGGNGKHILLVYNNPDSITSTEVEKEILNRMFSRLNTTFNDIVLLNVSANKSVSYQQLNKELSPKAFISFGLTPTLFNLNIEAKQYQILTMGNIKLLFCDTLLTIDKNNDLKKKFWAQFSPLFL